MLHGHTVFFSTSPAFHFDYLLEKVMTDINPVDFLQISLLVFSLLGNFCWFLHHVVIIYGHISFQILAKYVRCSLPWVSTPPVIPFFSNPKFILHQFIRVLQSNRFFKFTILQKIVCDGVFGIFCTFYLRFLFISCLLSVRNECCFSQWFFVLQIGSFLSFCEI